MDNQAVKHPRRWARTCTGLLLAAVICLALLWMAAPRLAEIKLARALVRLGVPAANFHLRSVTPWTLVTEPLRLGADSDGPALGALRVTYVPREILRGKLRTVTLDGARVVLRPSKSGGWELAGADKLLPVSGAAAAASPGKSFTQIMALIPERISVRGISVIAETEGGRLEFPLELDAVRRADQFDLRLTAGGAGGRAEITAVVQAGPGENTTTDSLTCTGMIRGLKIMEVDLGEIPFQVATDGKSVHAEAALRPAGGAFCAILTFAANLASKEIALSARLPPAPLRANDPALTPFLPASLKGTAFSGTLEGRAEATWKPGGAPQGTAELTLTSGTFAKDGWEARITNAVARGRLAPAGALSGFEGQCTLHDASLRIPAAALEAAGLDAELAFAWSRQSGLRSLAFPGKTSNDRIRSLKIRGVELGEITLTIGADGQAVRVAAALKPPGSALSATVAVSANPNTQEAAFSATIAPVPIMEKDPALAPFLPASLKGATFSGTLGGRADATWKPGGETKCRLEATLAGGKFATADGKFDVEGLEGGLKLESVMPLRSLPSQKLKFASAHAAGTALTRGRFTWRIDPPDTIFIEHGDVGWCGGRLSCAAMRIVGGKPDGMVMLRAEQVDIGQLTGLVKDFNGHAQGWLTGRLPLIIGTKGVRLGEVHLIGDPEKPGAIQLDPDKWPGNQVDTLGASPSVKQAMKQTLRNMSLNLLRIDTLPGADKTSTHLCLRIAGTPREDTDLPPVDLTINLNIDDRRNQLWNLMNQSVRMK